MEETNNNGKWCNCTGVQYVEILAVARASSYPVAKGASKGLFYGACWIISNGKEHSGTLNFFAPFCEEATNETKISVGEMKRILINYGT